MEHTVPVFSVNDESTNHLWSLTIYCFI